MPTSKSAGRTTIVRVSDEAFLAMCFACADAAVTAPDFNKMSYSLLAKWEKERGSAPLRKAPTPPPTLLFSETGHECSGLCLGSIRQTKNQTVISIDWAMTTIALNSDSATMQSGASSLLLADLCEAARSSLGLVVASWHSHPELTVSPNEVVEQELYAPSAEDFGPALPNSAVSLICTIAWPDQSKSRPADQPGLLCRRIGDFNFYLTGNLPGIRRWSATDPSLEISVGY